MNWSWIWGWGWGQLYLLGLGLGLGLRKQISTMRSAVLEWYSENLITTSLTMYMIYTPTPHKSGLLPIASRSYTSSIYKHLIFAWISWVLAVRYSTYIRRAKLKNLGTGCNLKKLRFWLILKWIHTFQKALIYITYH